jgi:hypothetical protein
MQLRSSWYTLLSFAAFIATCAVYLRSFSRLQDAFVTTVQPGSLDDLEQLGRFIEILDIHTVDPDGQRLAHQLADASFSNSHLEYLRAFIKFIEGEKIAVLVRICGKKCCILFLLGVNL